MHTVTTDRRWAVYCLYFKISHFWNFEIFQYFSWFFQFINFSICRNFDSVSSLRWCY